jgi:hypothetical protein
MIPTLSHLYAKTMIHLVKTNVVEEIIIKLDLFNQEKGKGVYFQTCIKMWELKEAYKVVQAIDLQIFHQHQLNLIEVSERNLFKISLTSNLVF